MSAPNPRKRPAPGTSPMVPMQPLQPPFAQGHSDGVLGWTAAPERPGFVDTGTPSVSSFTVMSPSAQYGAGAPSTALTRRQNNRALVHPQFDPEAWNALTEDQTSFLQPQNVAMDENDSIERLEERAARAKREAQAKRKQIPPFVQKLSSFLDESRNTDLIRWSEKGDSFIVLDEDEFAKTLIPELFKHNNYASFVRQLNMYGFHKRVGLSDNSMKASERKNKSPSEYHNPYFRRGHPNLLWLINKPKNTSGKKKHIKKDEVEAESDEDGVIDEVYAGQGAAAPHIGRASSAAQEIGPLQKKDLVQVKSQIERLQQQQVAISSMLNKLRQEHAALYQQAVMFQDMHNRHENSINAILNFLANVFRKSLEEQGGVQNMQDLLQSILPNGQAHSQPQMPQGTVVDLGDLINNRPGQNVVSATSTPKRQQRLLPPVPQHQVGKASTLSPAPTTSPGTTSTYQGPQMGSVTEVLDAAPAEITSPAYIKDELTANPQEGMMRIIHDTNAVNSSGIDLPDVAAKTPVTMTNDQRTKMLNMMAGSSPTTTAAAPPMNSAPISNPTPTVSASPNPAIAGTAMSLSPVLASIPPPNLQDFHATQAELDALEQLSNAQANGINALTTILGPLSPSGRIPGLDEHGNPNADYFGGIDYSQYLNADAFAESNFEPTFGGAAGVAGNTDGNDFNFALDGNGTDMGQGYVSASAAGTAGGVGGHEGGRIFETSSADTPSSTGTEEITRTDLGSPERDSKRRRRA